YVIGDKLSDFQRGLEGVKSIFVKWGHPAGGEEDYADYTITHPDELEGIIK
ncbi:HAD family hydrolase, partial [Candidatus Woesearchaeota archaeon]|nr:HAD family hydrolase [Candidatus Woesearchaeota archaeon]